MNTTADIAHSAAKVIFGHYGKFRGPNIPQEDRVESSRVAKLVREYLGEVNTWEHGAAERLAFYEALVEGDEREDQIGETYGTLAFELLVQFALSYKAFVIDRRILELIRSHAPAIPIDPTLAFCLARAVVECCRSRYAPHQKPLAHPPPEPFAPSLRRFPASQVALQYLRWVYAHSDLSDAARCQNLRRLILGAPGVKDEDRAALFYDVREDLFVTLPARPRSNLIEHWRAYSRNADAALVVALADFTAEGLSMEDVTRERAAPLARGLDVREEDAFGFLYYLAKRSRDR